MERRKLSADELLERSAGLSGWKVSNGKLTRRYEFQNFTEALSFVNKVGELAETADHHPDIRLGWGYAELDITTHDRGGITDHDLNLAGQINNIS